MADALDQPVTYLRSLVEFLRRRRGNAIFLGEANVSQGEQQRYFAVDGGDGVQMLFDFRTCAAQWLAHARGSAAPLIDALNSRPRHPEHAQFANFCRHHDELNLGMLSDREREEVFAAFAPEPQHRLYERGIRRRLAPMLGHDQQRIRLALALTMALPGTPVLMYGDEIGMGEDLSLPGRIAVRNPMQWSPEHAGGFSAASKTYRPARPDGPFGYRAINVLDQRHDPGSLYSLSDLFGAMLSAQLRAASRYGVGRRPAGFWPWPGQVSYSDKCGAVMLASPPGSRPTFPRNALIRSGVLQGPAIRFPPRRPGPQPVPLGELGRDVPVAQAHRAKMCPGQQQAVNPDRRQQIRAQRLQPVLISEPEHAPGRKNEAPMLWTMMSTPPNWSSA